jgi:hypothetical protein
MAEEKDQEKKIIIDEDWKTKAQKEKEVLKAKENIEKGHKEEDAEQAQQPLPQGDFSAIVSLLATQALFAMGLVTAENDKEPKKDLQLAKFHIDMLEALEQKTKGNLSVQEQKLLTSVMSRLRMGFVNAAGQPRGKHTQRNNRQ